MTEISHPLLQQGYVWRPMTRDDFAAVADFFNICNHDMGLTSVTTVEEVEEDFSESDFNMETSTRVVAAPDGSIILAITVWDLMQPPVRVFIDIFSHPQHADLALRLQALKWAEGRAKEAFVRCPDEARVVAHSFTIQGYAPDEEALKTAGYTHIRNFYKMLVEFEDAPPAVTMPEGYSLRNFNFEADLDLYVATRQDAWRDHFGYIAQPDEALRTRMREWRETDNLFDESLMFLAVHDETQEVAAFCFLRQEAYGHPDRGHVQIVGTRRAHRNKGVASTMLRHAFHVLWERGQKKVDLEVDGDSLTGAVALYERLGMKADYVEAIYELELRGGVNLMTTELEE
jgi:ribosomal protein S18 acetylase RimI-like enzyme